MQVSVLDIFILVSKQILQAKSTNKTTTLAYEHA